MHVATLMTKMLKNLMFLTSCGIVRMRILDCQVAKDNNEQV